MSDRFEPTPRLTPRPAGSEVEPRELAESAAPRAITELLGSVAKRAGFEDLSDERFSYARAGGETAEQYATTMASRWADRPVAALAQKAEEYEFAFQQGLREFKDGIIPSDVIAHGIVGSVMNLLAERRHLLDRRAELQAATDPANREELLVIQQRLADLADLEAAMQAVRERDSADLRQM
jgi:hypothetical protein